MSQIISVFFITIIAIIAYLKGIKSILLVEDGLKTLEKNITEEVTLRRCGELLAAKKNLIEAADFYSQNFPYRKIEVDKVLKEKLFLLQQKFDKLEDYNNELCYSESLKLSVVPYHQDNPDLLQNWPNWYFHFK